MVKRGEIWLVNLDPTMGNEIQKTRPCAIVSPPEMHDHLRTVMLAPMTTHNRTAPYRVTVRHAGKQGLILLDQLRSVDKVRLVKRVGTLGSATLTATLATLAEIFEE